MKKILFFILLFSIAGAAFSEVQTAPHRALREKNKNIFYPISVEYPAEKTKYTGLKNIFIFGSVFNAGAKLKINGLSTPVHKTGGWLAYIPLEQGDNEILLEAEHDGVNYQAVRRVSVSKDPACTQPQKEIYATTGDVIALKICAAPQSKITAEIKGVKKDILLTERDSGVYSAAYTITDKDYASSSKIIYRVNDKEKITAPGTLKILKKSRLPLVGMVEDAGTRARTAPVTTGSLYRFHRLYGKVLIDGKQNGLYRIMLDGANRAWVEEDKIKLTKDKKFTSNQISLVEISYDDEKTQIVFHSSQKTPLTISDMDHKFDVTFFYTNYFDDRYILSSGGPLIADAGHEFLSGQTINFVFAKKANATLWGYDYKYDDMGRLVLHLFHKPKLAKTTEERPLQGIKIFVDPGHSPKRTPPYDGAVGPTGMLEYEVNMDVATRLAALLRGAGAEAVLNREANEHLPLSKRTDKALEAKADIFVSIHHNALPDGVNPFSAKRGQSVYYFNEHSRRLAESVNKKMAAKFPLLENNGVLTGDLFVVRTPQMPSILTENLFMLYPEQEALLKDEKQLQNFADSIYEGILDFFGKTKPPVKKNPRKK